MGIDPKTYFDETMQTDWQLVAEVETLMSKLNPEGVHKVRPFLNGYTSNVRAFNDDRCSRVCKERAEHCEMMLRAQLKSDDLRRHLL